MSRGRSELPKLGFLGVKAAINAVKHAQELHAEAKRRADNLMRAPRKQLAERELELKQLAAEAVVGLAPDGADLELEVDDQGQLTGFVIWERDDDEGEQPQGATADPNEGPGHSPMAPIHRLEIDAA